ncbi:MAG: SDR family NAD(P)-dependent oxidoreductase [Gammaproteobacteria bacterium]|nr:SDR family NAD(P)-dependent oxidoreductase [Gammaproteobacteria bacterium]MDD9894567.1 SDR family NAD(P)-dependent oxidoreductase [Gammaproteobacteria bacterium]MDD9957815.1 SDR family NAD(P)-dependent oxidoreductase [Gammaproteobacteria bacterium]
MSNSAKVWLVTGGSRGIGRAIVEKALAGGNRVAVLARSPNKSNNEKQLNLIADVSDEAQLTAAIEQIISQWGRIDIVVNNAGLHRGGKASRLDLEDWEAVLQTNLTGALQVIRATESHLERGASIINIGAVVGFRGFPGDAAYASSKAGLAGLTRALAIEFASRDIRVNLVIPGLVLTDMTSGLSEKAMDSMRAMIPLGRLGTAMEIADVVHSVASATYMTGAFIPVDGGLMSTFGLPG